MQRMICQFAAEHTSKTRSSQDSHQPVCTQDQSLRKARTPAATPPVATVQRPILNKLPMEEQDSPLDLTVKKPDVVIGEQDGVLDLSTKKNHGRGSNTVKSPPMPQTVDKGGLGLEPAGIQSSSALEQFMAKLCLHHQRQIVDALGFLQTEVEASSSASASKTNLKCEARIASYQETSDIPSERTLALSSALQHSSKKITSNADSQPVSVGVPPLDLRKIDVKDPYSSDVSKTDRPQTTPLRSIRKSNLKNCSTKATGSQNKCPGVEEKQQCNSESFPGTRESETDLISHGRQEYSDSPQHPCQRDFPGYTKDIQNRPTAVLQPSHSDSTVSTRTARKSRRGNYRTIEGSVNDSDSHYDIVYVGRSITECQYEHLHRTPSRQNARKSIRGYTNCDKFFEQKTVRTLAKPKPVHGGSGNCPTPMPEITLVTPKQALTKPDGVPPLDMPFAGGCGESEAQQTPLEKTLTMEMPGGDVAAVIVETSQCEEMIPCCPQLPAQCDPPNKVSEEQAQDSVSVTKEQFPQSAVALPNQVDLNKTTESPSLPANAKADSPTEQICSPPDSNNVHQNIHQNIDSSTLPSSPLLDTVQEDHDNMEDVEATLALEEQNVTVVSEEPETTEMETETNISTPNKNELLVPCGNGPDTGPVCNNTETEEGGICESSQSLEQKSEETTLEKEEEVKETLSSPESGTVKRRSSRTPVSSDRCLRSRTLVSCPEITPDSGTQICPAGLHVSDVEDENVVRSEVKRSLRSSKLPVRDGISSEDPHKTGPNSEHTCEMEKGVTVVKPVENAGSDSTIQTRLKQKSMLSKPLNEDGQEKLGIKQGSDMIEVKTVPAKEKKEPSSILKGKDVPLKKKVDLPAPATVDGLETPATSSPASPRMSGHMPLRSGNSTSGASKQGDACRTPTGKPLENSEPLPVPNGSVVPDLPTETPSSSSRNLSESTRHMPLRSRNAGVAGDNPSAVSQTENLGHMPLRSNSLLTVQPMSPVSPEKNKKSPRPQRSKTAVLSSDTEHEQNCLPPKAKPEKSFQVHTKSPTFSDNVIILPKTEPTLPSTSKFLEALRGEENQQLIMNLNTRFDKIQKGWVQMDKEGHPAPRPKNKADRLKEIWKSKRRIRKPRPLDQHKFSPVQMLFMKSFDLPSICRWFLQSTETKSLVIVKKVNTRLPSETQLCFHSSSGVSGSSNGVFPSLQAERLKKHLKKFAIASPVKSNAKSRKLIAKALERGISTLKAKECRQLATATRISTKPNSFSAVTKPPPSESQKALAGGKNPASARILRKYSNIREKMQGQQNSRKVKESTIDHRKGANLKLGMAQQNKSKQKVTSVPGQKRTLAGRGGGKVTQVAKKDKVTVSSPTRERLTKSSSRALRDPVEKDGASLKKSPQTQMASKPPRTTTVHGSTPKPNVNKKEEKSPEKSGCEKSHTKASDVKVDVRKSPHTKAPDSLVSTPQNPDPKPQVSQDQVLTRSQRKMESTLRLNESPKSATKRGQEPVETPVKRTRTSFKLNGSVQNSGLQ
ncbi:uncharacterized protein LOC114795895 isoform X2 [Denticeps clupeoides]|nr:uncharacterized protein LOC114795895 isoform X2 [Denticeps clupeoides]